MALKCPKCGKVNPDNARFCWNDGEKFIITEFNPRRGLGWATLVLVLLVSVPALRLWVAHTPKPMLVNTPENPTSAAKPSEPSSVISAESNSVSKPPLLRNVDSVSNGSSKATSPKILADMPRHKAKREKSDLPAPTPYRGLVRNGQGATLRAYSDEIKLTKTTDDEEPKPYKGPLRDVQSKPGGEGLQGGYVQYGIDSNHEEQNQEPYRGRLR